MEDYEVRLSLFCSRFDQWKIGNALFSGAIRVGDKEAAPIMNREKITVR